VLEPNDVHPVAAEASNDPGPEGGGPEIASLPPSSDGSLQQFLLDMSANLRSTDKQVGAHARRGHPVLALRARRAAARERRRMVAEALAALAAGGWNRPAAPIEAKTTPPARSELASVAESPVNRREALGAAAVVEPVAELVIEPVAEPVIVTAAEEEAAPINHLLLARIHAYSAGTVVVPAPKL
jgi:hypothetical protein